MSNEITAVRRTDDERHPPLRRVYTRVKGGPKINEDTIATLPAAWACMRYLSGTVALLDWSLRREIKEGFETVKLSPLHRIINRRVSGEL